jgi:ketosteroid isomerase-like protein
MKSLLLILFITAMTFTSCQTKTKVLPADQKAAEADITKALDAHWAAIEAKDADAVMALLTDDFLSCGTDPEEFWNKTDMLRTLKQTLADTSLKIDITIDKRLIRIAKDGNSAIALEQMFLKPYSLKIPVRNIYHLVKDNGIWKFDFTSVGFIPENEDIEKLNKALE